MLSSISRPLLKQFEKGRIEVMLTTEPAAISAGESLYCAPLKCYIGRDSEIFQQRPLPLAPKPDCIFLPVARAALKGAGTSWETPYQANDWRDLVPFVSASLAVETNMPYMAKIKDWHEVPAEGGLPLLPDFGVLLYVREDASPMALQLAWIIRDVYFDPSAIAPRG